MSALLLAAAILLGAERAEPTSGWCQEMRITAYLRTAFSSHTFDGTPITTPERIAAASWNIPIDSIVDVDGLGTYRIADRGMLGSTGWVDIAVWDIAHAYALTSWRQVCVYPPGALR